MSASDAPKYAILSHTWEQEEVSFQDYINPEVTIRSNMKGYSKIVKTCELARNAGLGYAWVDTCCIDKASSAELTEAINSMYQWYKDSVVCYAWLSDLEASSGQGVAPGQDFKDCRWFTRGWTLQELIAPRSVYFYDRDWNFRGTKVDLGDEISQITHISKHVLQEPWGLDRLPIAERMSWAANRRTTRVEDAAYCLLGIFDVNMPMLYGEGARAFIRLQEEIAKDSNDLSLFAWRARTANEPVQPSTSNQAQYSNQVQTHRGVFAESPSEFYQGGGTSLIGDSIFNTTFHLTNKGLQINADIHDGENGTYLMMLNCAQPVGPNKEHLPIGIFIKAHGGGVYSRIRADQLGDVPLNNRDPGKTTLIYLFKRLSASRSESLRASHSNAFMFRKNFNSMTTLHYPLFGFRANMLHPAQEWDSQRRMFLTQGSVDFSAHALFMTRDDGSLDKELMQGQSFTVVFGRDNQTVEPWVTIGGAFDDAELYKGLGDVKKMKLLTKNMNKKRVVIRTMMNKPGPSVVVSLETVMMEGEPVHCIDLDFEDESLAGLEDSMRGLDAAVEEVVG